MSPIFSYIRSSAPGNGLYENTTCAFRLSGVKYVSLYRVMYRPSRSPISSTRNSAHKSINPLLAGVPVSPTIRDTNGRTFKRYLNRFAW